MNRQLSELSEMLSADELNDAIDDRNFPQSHSLSRGRNNSVCSNTSNASEGRVLPNGNTSANDAAVESDADNSNAITRNGFIKRDHPTSLTFSNTNVQDRSNNSTKTPTTPRTSTTPGG